MLLGVCFEPAFAPFIILLYADRQDIATLDPCYPSMESWSSALFVWLTLKQCVIPGSPLSVVRIAARIVWLMLGRCAIAGDPRSIAPRTAARRRAPPRVRACTLHLQASFSAQCLVLC